MLNRFNAELCLDIGRRGCHRSGAAAFVMTPCPTKEPIQDRPAWQTGPLAQRQASLARMKSGKKRQCQGGCSGVRSTGYYDDHPIFHSSGILHQVLDVDKVIDPGVTLPNMVARHASPFTQRPSSACFGSMNASSTTELFSRCSDRTRTKAFVHEGFSRSQCNRPEATTGRVDLTRMRNSRRMPGAGARTNAKKYGVKMSTTRAFRLTRRLSPIVRAVRRQSDLVCDAPTRSVR